MKKHNAKILIYCLLGLVLITRGNSKETIAAQNLTLNASHKDLNIKDTFLLKADAPKTITFKSSNTKIATVSKKGIVTAKKYGKTIIHAKNTLTGAATSCSITVRKTPTYVIGHRGYSGGYPENTNRAIEEAFKAGFDGIETDLIESRSGQILVFHDSNLKRMCHVNLNSWLLSEKQRKSYPIVSGNNVKACSKEDLIIPTLNDVLKIAKKYNKRVYLHLKPYPQYGYYISNNGLNKIASSIKKYKMAAKTIVFSPERSYILHLKNKGISLGVTSRQTNYYSMRREVSFCKKNKIGTLVFSNPDMLANKNYNQSFTAYCHKNNIRTGAYFANSRKTFDHIKKIHADFGFTDYRHFD